MEEVVTFTPEKLADFKAELAKHQDRNATFKFQGDEYLVSYARYLVEYLESVFSGS
jgi:hypothetical protein